MNIADNSNIINMGFNSIADPYAHYQREKRAYCVEIKLKQELGNKDAVARIKENLEKESRRIYGE